MTQILLAVLAALPLVGQEEHQESIDQLIDTWKHGDAAAREKATDELLSRWLTLSKQEISRLNRARASDELHVSSLASDALARIQIRRDLGEPLVRQVPNIDTALRGRNSKEWFRVLENAQDLLYGRKVDPSDVARVVTYLKRTDKSLSATQLLKLTRKRRSRPLARRSRPLAPLMVPLLQSKNPSELSGAIEALGHMGDRSAIPEIRKHLKHAEENVRSSAILALRQLHAVSCASDLLSLAQDPQKRDRRLAIWTLGEFHHHESKSVLFDRLNQEETSFQITIIGVMARINLGEDSKRLLDYLDDPWLSGSAAQALGIAGDTEAIEQVLPLLKDKDKRNRQMAVYGLSRVGDSRHASSILALLNDPDREVRESVAKGLGWMRAEGCTEDLASLLDDPESLVRRYALEALGHLGDKQNAKTISKFLNHEGRGERRYACTALGQLGATEFAQAVANNLKDEDRRVRIAAARAIGRLGASKQVLELLHRLQHDPDDRSLSMNATISLIRLGKVDATAQRRLLQNIQAFGYVGLRAHGRELFDALACAHEPERYRRLSEDQYLDERLGSVSSFAALLKKQGLQFEAMGNVFFFGRLPPGISISPLEALRRLHHLRYPVIDGTTVRWMGGYDALDYWLKRLEQK